MHFIHAGNTGNSLLKILTSGVRVGTRSIQTKFTYKHNKHIYNGRTYIIFFVRFYIQDTVDFLFVPYCEIIIHV